MKLTTNIKTPQITGTYKVCPIPFKMDTYAGCTFGCKYCFARDIIQHIRKINKKDDLESNFNYLVGADVPAFNRWVNNTLNKDSSRPEKIAFKERIPIKLGVVADPFPFIEKQTRITYNILKTLNNLDYPVQISTKNPAILSEYIDDFIIDNKVPNWALSVTLITSEEKLRKHIEPYAPTIEDRLNAVKELTDKGLKVLIRIQPVIYPYIMNNLKDLINKIHKSGAYGIIMEGLKIRIVMDKKEQEVYQQIGEYLGYDIRQWYKEHGERSKSDYEIKKEDKLKYINYAKELCNQYGMVVYVGDNNCREHSCNGECCGTNLLRKHKTLYESDKLLHCKITNTRVKTDKTIRESLEKNSIFHSK